MSSDGVCFGETHSADPMHNEIEKFQANFKRYHEQTQSSTGQAAIVFPLQAFENIRLDTNRRGYLVKHLLATTGLSVIWGPPKCGKSFWALDLALHIALGRKYRAHTVQQAAVVYVALEGRHGFPARIEAFRRHHGVTEAPFYLLLTKLDLVKQADRLIADIQAQLGTTQPGVIFIDTLNRSLVGSESKDEDMAAYIAAAGMLEEVFGCLVAIVHHCGIEGSRPRGHSSLTGAVESQLKVERTVTGEVIVTVEWAKDFAEGTEVVSRLEVVELGTDRDGDPITSMIVVPAEGSSPSARKAGKLSVRQRRAKDALAEAVLAHGVDLPSSYRLPSSLKGITSDQWREELYRRKVIDEQTTKNPRARFGEVRDQLADKRLIGVRDDWVWLAVGQQAKEGQ
jgi:hypothetical protein